VRTFAVTMRGPARAGSVEVEHDDPGAPLAAWLAAGRHAAVLLSGAQLVTPARDA
jgi:hypothetical protein